MTDLPERPESLDHLYAAISTLIADVGDSEKQLGIETDGYGKCVEAMWRAGYLAVECVAHQLGVTGFQHSAAMLTLYGKAMHIDGPFMVMRLHDALYPQYDLQARTFIEKNRDWLAEQARELLAKYEAEPTLTYRDPDTDEMVTAPTAHPRVVAHWRELIANAEAEPIR